VASGITANKVLTNSLYTSVATPGGIPNPAQILILQTPYNAPSSAVIQTITNGLNIPPIMSWRFRNFSENVYSLRPTDHIVRFTKVLLGQAGAGQYRSRSLSARLQSTLNGANFYDLDSFYGDIFGIQRDADEVLDNSPYTGLDTYDNWALVRSQNSSYVGRIDQFSKAISWCPTTFGIQAVSEAILEMPVTIIEQSTNGYSLYKTYRYLEQDGGTSGPVIGGAHYSDLETYTYASLEGSAVSASTGFIISPSQAITDEQEYALRSVIDTLKPANVTYTITQTGSSQVNPVPLRGVYSDSSYWNLVESIIPAPEYAGIYHLSSTPDANGFFEVLRPYGSEYQGELVVYNNDIQVIASGINPTATGNYTADPETDTVVFYDGSYLSYPPSNGVASRLSYVTSRLVSDGILQSNLLSANSGYSSTSDVLEQTGYAPPQGSNKADPLTLYVDGVSLYDLTQILNGGSLGSEDTNQRFWATPRRISSDSTTETMQISFSQPKLINEIACDVAHYPHYFEIWAEVSGVWESVFSTSFLDSVPAVLPATPPDVKEHPQHLGDGHWASIIAEFEAVTAQNIQVRMTRIPSTQAPQQQPYRTQGIPTPVFVPYSLGVRNLSVNYSVAKQSDLPTMPLFTKDALGSRVEWTVRQETSDRAIDASKESTAWRSAPQYSSDSVVNFFLDTRTANGQPQVIDSIYIDPLYPGPHVSLYYSDQNTADLGNSAEYTPFSPPISTITGTIVGASDGLEFDTINPSYVQIENGAMQWDPTQPWWIGSVIWPQFSSEQSNGQIIWDSQSGMSLSVQPPNDGSDKAFLTLTIANGSTAAYPLSWDSNDNVTVTVAYVPEGSEDFLPGLWIFAATNYDQIVSDTDPEAWIQMFVQTNLVGLAHPEISPIDDSYQSNRILPQPPDQIVTQQPIYLCIGGNPSATSPASFVLSNFIVKQETVVLESLNTFAADPSKYIVTSQYANGIAGLTTTNAVVRFDPSFISDSNPTGMVGGPGNFYENLTWVPIPRDYTASKGYMVFPPTNASFWKLEFTNLVAQPINIMQPIERTYRNLSGLPQSFVNQPTNISTTNPGQFPVGSDVTQRVMGGNGIGFTDATTVPNSVPTPNSIPSTATQTIPDLQLQQAQAQTAWYWQYQNAAQALYAPKFTQSTTHDYSSGTVFHGNQVGYFTGLNSIQAYRTSNLGTLNSVLYDEFFLDTEMIQSSTWDSAPGDLNTQGMTASFAGSSVQATSVPFMSSAPVVGVQFATSQSEAQQLAYNDSFLTGNGFDSNYNWQDLTKPNSIGYFNTTTNQWVSYGDAQLLLNTANNYVTVSRSEVFSVLSPTNLMVQPDVHPILDSPFTTNYFVTNTAGDGSTYQQYTVSSSAPTQPFEVGQLVTVTNTTNSYNVTGATITAVGGTSGAWWFKVVGSTANSSSTGNASITVPDSNYGGLATSWIAPATTWSPTSSYVQSQYTSGTELWAAVKITGISNITSDSPLYLEIVDAGSTPSYNPTVLVSLPIEVSPGQTIERTIGVVVNSSNYVYAQIVQRNASSDSWIVNQLSVFDEGVYWSFSNDGTNWYRTDKIRNRADSQLTFPTPKSQIQWRATATRPNVHINGLRVRPVYTTPGVRYPQGTKNGPNLSFFEAQPPVENDPLFNAWPNAVPYSWYNSSYYYSVGNPNGTPLPNQFTSNYSQSLSDTISVTDTAIAHYVLPTQRTGSDTLVTTDAVSSQEGYNAATTDAINSLSDSATAVVIVLPTTSQMVDPIIQDLSE